jgi:phosphoenolpyruvate-protein phosphotransferase (PTS system enzyme I)
MTEVLEEIVLEGAPISGGIAIGRLFFLEGFQEELVPEFSIASSEIEKEVGRYRRAVHLSRDDLNDLQRFLAKEGSTEAVSIIDTHIQMLEDPFMTTFMEKKIRERLKNTEVVFRSVMSDYEKEFSKVKDSFFKQRLLDVKDLSERILRNLHPRKLISTADIPHNSVVFTKELAPSSTAEASKGQILGFITELGGMTSHAALIARSKGIPYVANVSIDVLHPLESSMVIVDGETGSVIINPTNQTLSKYDKKKSQNDLKQTRTLEEAEAKTETADGIRVEVLANIENLSDLDLLSPYKAEGIGLFRSEFLFFGKELHNFSEEDQFILYQQVMKKAQGMPVVFRTFDVGGDKGNVHLYDPEPNPALGCRAIRYLLRNREIFAHQLRALLRVSLDGDLRILLPLISDVSELIQAKELIQEVAIELRAEGHEIAEEIPVGSMLEVPSAVIICDLISKECDFISIGTNDLIQYTLAADRATQDVHSFYKPTHPSIIRMIEHTVKEASKTQTPVSLCGEMASDPLMTPLLIGLGIRKLSCASRYIPLIRKMVSQINLEETKALVEEVLKLETSEQIDNLLKEKYQKLVFEIS